MKICEENFLSEDKVRVVIEKLFEELKKIVSNKEAGLLFVISPDLKDFDNKSD